jgi:gas vesicle protein
MGMLLVGIAIGAIVALLVVAVIAPKSACAPRGRYRVEP